MTYIALYRTWRPQTFNDVIGQEPITQTLQNALKQNRFSHAYLFSGPRGTGKTSVAKIFSKTVNCENCVDGEPCNTCNTCKSITNGSVLDVVEIDAASNRGIDEIREIRENVKFTPTETKFKVYIIDEVHMLTTEAFNALLKTLEEPPEHVIFILATTEQHKIPLTIISRCQSFDFKRVSNKSMINRIRFIAESEGFTIEEEALNHISRYSDGGMRDALSLLDQVMSVSENEISLENVIDIAGRISYQSFSCLAKQVSEKNISKVLDLASELVHGGKEPYKIIEDLMYYYRDILLLKTAPSLEEIQSRVMMDKEIRIVAEKYTDEQLFMIIETLNKYLNDMKNSNQSKILLELVLIKITKYLSQNIKNEKVDNLEIEEMKIKIVNIEKQLVKIKDIDINKKNLDNTKNNNKSEQIIINNNNVTDELCKLKSNFSSDKFQLLNNMWPDILQNVKQNKVTVHAWLINGDPVAVSEDTIVIAFSNEMHRDTTNRKPNLQLIKEAIYEKTGVKYNIVNIMKKEWEKFSLEGSQEKENFIKEDSKDDEDLVTKVSDIFGEELLEIKN